jgi:hypothetical protein
MQPRYGNNITIVSGTAQQLIPNGPNPKIVTRFVIQTRASGTGTVYIFLGVPSGTTPSISTFPYQELAPPANGAPGGSLSDRIDITDDMGIDLSSVWIDGSHTGDVVAWSANFKI